MPLKGKPLSLFVYEKNSTFQNKAFKKIKAALNKNQIPLLEALITPVEERLPDKYPHKHRIRYRLLHL